MNKQERVQHWVHNLAGDEFRLQDVRRALPGVSDQTIRLALEPLKLQGVVKAEGSGRVRVGCEFRTRRRSGRVLASRSRLAQRGAVR